jgi:hypothetical protein
VRGESHGHFLAEARSAAGHEDAFSLEETAAEHRRAHPFIRARLVMAGSTAIKIVARAKIDTLLYFMCKPASYLRNRFGHRVFA